MQADDIRNTNAPRPRLGPSDNVKVTANAQFENGYVRDWSDELYTVQDKLHIFSKQNLQNFPKLYTTLQHPTKLYRTLQQVYIIQNITTLYNILEHFYTILQN